MCVSFCQFLLEVGSLLEFIKVRMRERGSSLGLHGCTDNQC